MSKIYLETLDKERVAVFRKLDIFKKDFYLIGGTAIALQLKHRKSVDFDLASPIIINRNLLHQAKNVFIGCQLEPIVDQPSELTVLLNSNIKITFLHYPFEPLHPLVKTESVDLAPLPDLASTKAQAIGRRGEWKDYVDLYFLLTKANLKVKEIIKEAEKRFGGEFSEKLFWEQLVYWSDIVDFKIDYLGEDTPASEIQNFFRQLVKKYI